MLYNNNISVGARGDVKCMKRGDGRENELLNNLRAGGDKCTDGSSSLQTLFDIQVRRRFVKHIAEGDKVESVYARA